MIVGSYDDVIADRCVQRRIINEEPVCEPKAFNSGACFPRCFCKFLDFRRHVAWKLQSPGVRVRVGGPYQREDKEL